MRALVTGAAGFIGSHLCEALLTAGHSVVGIDDLSTGFESNLDAIRDNPAFRFCMGPAGHQPLLSAIASGCDFIFHLAATVGVKRVIDEPVQAVANIVETTSAVLDVAKFYQLPVLLTSTSEVYGKSDRIPFREDDDVTLGPTSSPRWAYAAAKMVDEFHALAYHRQFRLPVRIARLFNTVGPRQTGMYGMVLPRFVQAAKERGLLTVYGDGMQTRCFCSVHDVVAGLVELAGCDDAIGQVINLGTDKEISICDLAVMVCSVLGAPCNIKHVSIEEAYGVSFVDMPRRKPCLDRARELIGWAPKQRLEAVIREVAEGMADAS